MIAILAYIASYFIGAIPVGVLVARAKGVDIMSTGSGNIGATNVGRVLGKKAGILVFILDILKGVVPTVAVHFLGIDGEFGLSLVDQQVICGVLAILGHMLSPFLKFKGGKGIATGLGALLGTAPLIGICAFGIFLLFFALTRIVSLSSILAVIGVVTMAATVFPHGTLFLVVYSLVVLYVIIKHIPNMKRLLKGEEPKFEFKKDSKPDLPEEE